jgi:hypothetical protein
VLLYIIAFWVIFTGVAEGRRGHRAAVRDRGRVGPVPRRVLSVFLGVVMAVLPGVGLLSHVWLVGLYALAVGVALIMLAFGVRGRLVGITLVLVGAFTAVDAAIWMLSGRGFRYEQTQEVWHVGPTA